ncbi:acyl-[acyl-carrier-protein] thioesterase [Nocardia sp. NPDC050175]|uniref:acyl-[acyl-carrier-protein] thioesterase n=1 Tax=Nocardia sp. NPDC050175 TaxID=3364317 RepID=UPI0037B713BA
MTKPVGMLPDPPSENAGYATRWPVRAGDVDRNGRLRLDGIARYLQDIAWEDLNASGFVDSDPAWIVRRTVIDVIEPIRWPDHVSLRRWCSGVSTRWANMRVRLTSDAGGLVETEAFWINVDEKAGTTARISEAGFEHLSASTDEHRLRWAPMLDRMPAAPSARDLAYQIREADIDLLLHMNNAMYWQAVEQFLPGRAELLVEPYRAIIEYNAPITADQSLHIRSEDRPTGLHLWFVTGEKCNAAVHLGPIQHMSANAE